MKIEVGSVDFLDDFEEGVSKPVTCHCVIEIGESAAKGFDLFFANVSNRHWAIKHLGHDQTGFCETFLIVDQLGEAQIRNAIQSEFGERSYSRFEDFVEVARPVLRWEFERYQSQFSHPTHFQPFSAPSQGADSERGPSAAIVNGPRNCALIAAIKIIFRVRGS